MFSNVFPSHMDSQLFNVFTVEGILMNKTKQHKRSKRREKKKSVFEKYICYCGEGKYYHQQINQFYQV